LKHQVSTEMKRYQNNKPDETALRITALITQHMRASSCEVGYTPPASHSAWRLARWCLVIRGEWIPVRQSHQLRTHFPKFYGHLRVKSLRGRCLFFAVTVQTITQSLFVNIIQGLQLMTLRTLQFLGYWAGFTGGNLDGLTAERQRQVVKFPYNESWVYSIVSVFPWVSVPS
jgi:hypothetical protein